MIDFMTKEMVRIPFEMVPANVELMDMVRRFRVVQERHLVEVDREGRLLRADDRSLLGKKYQKQSGIKHESVPKKIKVLRRKKVS